MAYRARDFPACANYENEHQDEMKCDGMSLARPVIVMVAKD
jgi:hypothetical protein